VKNTGKEAERSFVAYWQVHGHIERLRDRADLVALNGDKSIKDFAKPSDFLVSSKDTALHFAEVKSTMDAKCLPFGNIKMGQHTAALMEARRGAGSYVFYIFSYAKGRWYIMPASQYAALVDEGRRSVKFEELLQWAK